MLSDGDTFDYKGYTFAFKTERDDGMGEPWKEHDGHGPVTEWERRDKHPGERVLTSSHGSKRFYDVAEATRIAKRDGWGLCETELAELRKKLGREPTKGEVTAAAVDADFDLLRRWCNDDWYWIGVIVTLVDEEGEEDKAYSESLWGIESDSDEYPEQVAHELADDIIHQLKKASGEAEAEAFAARCDEATRYVCGRYR